MPGSEVTATPDAAAERRVLESVVTALAGGAEVVDVAALADEAPEAGALVAAVRETVRDGSVVLCAGVLERLTAFGELVDALTTLAAERGATVVIAARNGALADGGAEAPGSVWGVGAIEELRHLLPSEHHLWHEVALRGAALVPHDASVTVEVAVEVEQTAPTGFVVAFGPRADGLVASAAVRSADVSAERAHERARTAELEVLRARVENAA